MVVLGVVLAIMILVIETIFFKKAMSCLSYVSIGRVYVKVYLNDKKMYGWIKRSEYNSCRYGKLRDYEFIEIETKGKFRSIVIREVKRIEEVRNIVIMVIGNL